MSLGNTVRPRPAGVWPRALAIALRTRSGTPAFFTVFSWQFAWLTLLPGKFPPAPWRSHLPGSPPVGQRPTRAASRTPSQDQCRIPPRRLQAESAGPASDAECTTAASGEGKRLAEYSAKAAAE